MATSSKVLFHLFVFLRSPGVRSILTLPVNKNYRAWS